MNAWNVIKMAGAWIGFCVGSGFATGTALMQVYGSHGIMMFGILAVQILMDVYFAYSFIHLGFKGECKNAMDIFEYYCGPYLGKAFKVLTIVFLFLSPLCMVSGFGATANQQWGWQPWVGAVIMAVVCLITVLLGLKKLVNAVGAVGPIIIILSLLIGGYGIISHLDTLASGMAASVGSDILKYNESWFVSGLLADAWAPLILGPFLVACCKTINSEKEGRVGSILGAIGVALAITIMVLAYMAQFDQIKNEAIPTLYLVKSISPALASVFMIFVFLGIYSSAVPSQFNLVDTFAKEGTPKYTIIAIITILASCLASFFIDFTVLFNRVYVFFSYASWLFIACMIFTDIKELVKRKKAKAEPAE